MRIELRNMRVLAFLFLVGIAYQGFSQKKIYVSFASFESPDSIYKDWSWTINGVKLSRKNDSVKVKINYPKLDTIYFRRNDGASPELMLTRFNKGRTYFFTVSEVTEFDLKEIPAEEEEEKAPVPKIPGMQGEPVIFPDEKPMEDTSYGTVQFNVTGLADTGLIIGSFGDIGTGLSNGYILYFADSTTHMLKPFLSTYSDHVNYLVMGWGSIISANEIRSDWFLHNPYMVSLKGEGSPVFGVYSSELLRVRLRFFNYENLQVYYNVKTGTVKYVLSEDKK